MLHKRLRLQRQTMKLSQQELAEMVGVEPNTIGRYERESEKRMPPSDILSKIADALDCTTDYLLGRTDEPDIVHYNTGVDYEGERVYIDIVKEALDKGLTKEDINEYIEMGLAWREAREKREKYKKPNKD